MTAHSIVAALGIYAGTFVVGAISSVVPLVSIDVFLVGITFAAGLSGAVPIALVVILAAAGQLAGKLPIYVATRGVVALPGPHRARIARLRARLARWQRAPHLVLATSAVVGLPPFSLVATAAGALAIGVRPFCLVVFAGRGLRFTLVIAATALASR